MNKQKYIKNNGSCCPICNSINIKVIECGIDDNCPNRIKRVVDCIDCGSQWNDFYTLSDIEIQFNGEDEQI